MKASAKQFGKLFWFLKKRGAGLDFSRDKHMIIHQTLALGSMKDVQKLFFEYGRDEIKKEFLKPAKGLYYPSVLNFFEHVLDVKVEDKKQYLKNIYEKTSLGNS